MAEAEIVAYEFDDFQVDLTTRKLWRAGEECHLPDTPFRVLLFFLEQRTRFVTLEELKQEFWPHELAEENNVHQQIKAIRKVLGKAAILFVRRQGFKFGAEVRVITQSDTPKSANRVERLLHTPPPSNRFAYSCCFTYALLHALIPWVEVGLQVNAHVRAATLSSVSIFACIFASAYGAIRYCQRAVHAGKEQALWHSTLIFLLGGALSYGCTWYFLPWHGVNGASAPQEIYLLHGSIMAGTIWLCFLVPFHFYLSLQQEMTSPLGVANAIHVLRHDPQGIRPRGSFALPGRVFFGVLVLTLLYVMTRTAPFIASIKPQRFRTFYVSLCSILWLLFYAFIIGLWYWAEARREELKRLVSAK